VSGWLVVMHIFVLRSVVIVTLAMKGTSCETHLKESGIVWKRSIVRFFFKFSLPS